jgi:hypothetical protein
MTSASIFLCVVNLISHSKTKVMKTLLMKSLAIISITAALFSFTNPAGGEGFEVYLDNKLVLQKFGKDMNTVQNITLNEGNVNSNLTVKYYHCGQAGKNRVITLKDGSDRILKEWRFADAKGSANEMKCNAKEIFSFKKGNTSSFKLYYSAGEMASGRLLASITINNKPTAAP